VNVVSPAAVSQAQFAAALKKEVRRPIQLPLPAWLARLAAGRLADELLLADAIVKPAKLLAAGFSFEDGDFAGALTRLLSAEGSRAIITSR
jgi:NAD dependent epimerase/dehydratase family enzyme